MHDLQSNLNPDGPRADREVSILTAFARAVLLEQSLEDLMWSLAERIGTLLCFDDCVIYLIEDGVLVQKAAFGVKNPVGREIFQPITIPIGEGIVGRVAQLGVAQMIRDVRNDPTYIPDQFPGMSELAVPIIFEGRVIGVLDSEADETGAYSEEDKEALQWLANIAAPRIVSAQREEALKAAEQELRRANERLEQRVAERTGDLSRAIASLEDQIEERQRIERALETEKQRAHATLQSMSEGVIAIDPYGRIILFNTAAEAITGWSESDALGKRVDDLIWTAPDEALPMADERVQADERVDRRLRRRDGSELRVHQTKAPVLTGSGEKLGDVLVIRDETERRALMEEVERSNKLDSLGVLAGGIAHQFNNLLAVVRGSIDLLEVTPDGAARDNALQRAILACEQAATLPKQMISLAKGGEPVLGPPKSITPLLERVVALIVDRTRFDVSMDIDVDLLPARFDEAQINSLMHNLLQNAQEAMGDQGQIVVRARNSVFGDDATACIRVAIEDDGPGIPPSLIDRIFNPFYSATGTGTGLGLTTAHSIAKRHGGTLQVRSEVGVGAEFELMLPATLQEAPVPERSDGSGESPAMKGHIFVLEDEPNILTLLDIFLTSMGHTTSLFTTGEALFEALQGSSAESAPCDLVLTDLVVRGGWGGTELMRAMSDAQIDIPIVVMSGYAADPVFAQQALFGYADKLAKPFRRSDLERVVADVLKAGRDHSLARPTPPDP